MKGSDDAILRPAQAAFLERLLPSREPILAEMEAEAGRDGIPISDPEVGLLLTILARAVGARRIVEVGTAIGYGALCLARGAPEARIYTVDKDPERLSRARDYLDRAGVVPRVQLLEGAALELLPTIDGPIDLIYLDAVKTEYSSYVELLLPALRKGGLILADNLLWKGWVADPPAEADGDADTGALRAFATYLTTHPRLEALVLPLGDGVGLATKVA